MLKNGLYNVAAGAVRIGLAVITIPVLIRLLGIEEYGLWTLASAVMGMLGLAEAGLSTTTTVFVSKDLGNEDTKGLSQTLTVTVGAMLILATLAGISLWLGAEAIVSLFPKLGQTQQLKATQALQISGLIVWTRLLQQVIVGIEQGYQRYDLLSALNTIQSGLFSLGILVVAWLGGRTVDLMQWQAIASVMMLLSHVWVVRLLLRGRNLHFTWNKEKGLSVGRYSIMMWFTSLGSALFNKCDRLIVGNFLGTQILGIYAAITDITTQINSFSALPVQPLLPSLSILNTKQNIARSLLHYQVKQALQINVFVALGLGANLIMLSSIILPLVFPKEIAIQYLLPFCITVIIYSLYSINAVGYYTLLSTNAVKACAVIQLISGVLSLLIIAIGAHSFGLIGATVGNSGYLTSIFLTFLGMKKLSIPNNVWIKWLQFPLIWFVLTILVGLTFSHENILVFITALLQTSILFSWFAINNKNVFYKVFAMVKP